MKRWIVVGAGLAGATIAERLAAAGKTVTILDSRDEVAGLAQDGLVCGELVHLHGPHVFHTDDARVWEYLQQFGSWAEVQHEVLSQTHGTCVPVPINSDSIRLAFGYNRTMESVLAFAFGVDADVPLKQFRENADPDIRHLGECIYKRYYKPYTAKRWGPFAEAVEDAVMARVPLRIGSERRYYRCKHEGTPTHGYTALVRAMLGNGGVTLELGTEYGGRRSSETGVVYTGRLDRYFDFGEGILPYRSALISYEVIDLCGHPDGAQVVVHPDLDKPYLRTTEYRALLRQHRALCPQRRYSIELPVPHVGGQTEPYYPVPTAEALKLRQTYLDLAKQEKNVWFLGRLATHQYLNMDHVVGNALNLAEELVKL